MIFHPSSARRVRRFIASATILSACLMALAAGAASASSAPYSSYWFSCASYPGLGGDVITAQPKEIDSLPGTGLSVLGGSNPYNNNTYGVVYYWLGVYSTTKRAWVWSYPVNTPAPYMFGMGYRWNGSSWGLANTGWAYVVDLSNPSYYPDLTIPGDSVGVHVPPGTYSIDIATYWAPLSSTGDRTGSVPGGGVRSDATATVRCV